MRRSLDLEQFSAEEKAEEELYYENLKILKEGVKVVYILSKRDLENLDFSTNERKTVADKCASVSKPINGGYLRVNKVVTLNWQLDMSSGEPLPEMLSLNAKFDPFPKGLEKVSGPNYKREEVVTDKVLFHNFRIKEITQNIPFETIFSSNIHAWSVETASVLSKNEVYLQKRLNKEPFAELRNEATVGIGWMRLHPRDTSKYVPIQSEQNTLLLPGFFEPKAAMAAAAATPETLSNGVHFCSIRDPFTQKQGDFAIMNASHFVATFIFHSWRLLKIHISQVSPSSSNQCMYMVPRDVYETLVAGISEEMPVRVPIVPVDKISFGLIRSINECSDWYVMAAMLESIKTREDLCKVWNLKVEVELQYSLRPVDFGNRVINWEENNPRFTNTEDMKDYLKSEAHSAMQKSKIGGIDISKLDPHADDMEQ